MAAGLSGAQTVTSTAATFSWARPAPGAVVVARPGGKLDPGVDLPFRKGRADGGPDGTGATGRGLPGRQNGGGSQRCGLVVVRCRRPLGGAPGPPTMRRQRESVQRTAAANVRRVGDVAEQRERLPVRVHGGKGDLHGGLRAEREAVQRAAAANVRRLGGVAEQRERLPVRLRGGNGDLHGGLHAEQHAMRGRRNPDLRRIRDVAEHRLRMQLG